MSHQRHASSHFRNPRQFTFGFRSLRLSDLEHRGVRSPTCEKDHDIRRPTLATGVPSVADGVEVDDQGTVFDADLVAG